MVATRVVAGVDGVVLVVVGAGVVVVVVGVVVVVVGVVVVVVGTGVVLIFLMGVTVVVRCNLFPLVRSEVVLGLAVRTAAFLVVLGCCVVGIMAVLP